mgnify:CR=1 FL=1|tara:strand:+ start:199 stop:717 length:519 start_codon:yes stop_codon:yes gene_type:complete
MIIEKPSIDQYPEFYSQIIDSVKSNNLIEELKQNKTQTISFFNSVSKDSLITSYQNNKWTIVQILRHIIDCEELYILRTKHFINFNTSTLPDFDVNKAMEKIDKASLELERLIIDFEQTRNKTINLFSNLSLEQLDFIGKASNYNLTARSLGFITVGHSKHHMQVIKDKYLK